MLDAADAVQRHRASPTCLDMLEKVVRDCHERLPPKMPSMTGIVYEDFFSTY